MTPSIQKLRDEMATKHCNKYFNPKAEDDEWQHEFETFVYGFTAAHDIMLKDMLELVEALEQIELENHVHSDSYINANEALKNWRSKYETE